MDEILDIVYDKIDKELEKRNGKTILFDVPMERLDYDIREFKTRVINFMRTRGYESQVMLTIQPTKKLINYKITIFAKVKNSAYQPSAEGEYID